MEERTNKIIRKSMKIGLAVIAGLALVAAAEKSSILDHTGLENPSVKYLGDTQYFPPFRTPYNR